MGKATAPVLSGTEPVPVESVESVEQNGRGVGPLDASSQIAESSQAEFDGGLLCGRIHRDDGRPVPSAALTLIDPRGHQVARATGAGDGSYALSAPEAGSYVLIVSATGHQPAAVNVAVGRRRQQLDLTLMGSCELSGVVRTAGHGEPLPGATITLTDLCGEVLATATTADDGAYVCHGLVSGIYTVVAVAERMRPSATALTVPDGGLSRHDIELAPLAVLAGSAWADSRAAPDIHIRVLDESGELTATARTDENGRYIVPDLPAGRYTVVARGYPPVTSQITVSGGETTHDVRLGYRSEDGS
ncbi:carboxypeptidase-like regulatory domain-containing protein [Nocardia sp. NPDC050408]|uniref:MSCRAMM family protein n=1 Tax=unclassified Nocardia TaxID=2637762 RepID=UPI003417144E